MTTTSNETEGDDAAVSSHVINEDVSSVEALPLPPPPPPPPPPPQPIRTPPAALSGLFSRVSVAAQHVGAAAQQAQAPGGLLEVAQRRAVRLRENALAEVERLRHQREEAANIGEEFVIPPPAGILIDGDIRPPTPSDKMTDVHGEREQNKQQRGEEISTNIITKLGDTINMVKRSSREAAEGLIFPRDVRDDDLANNHSSSNDDDDDNDSSSEEEDGDARTTNDRGNSNDDDSDVAVALATSTLDDDSVGGGKIKPPLPPAVSPARFTAATNVLNAAVGRYRRLKEGAMHDVSSPNPPPSPGQRPQQRRTPLEDMPVVGGAEWVGGLRNFHLDGLFDKIDNVLEKIDTIPNLPLIPTHATTDAVSVGDTSLGVVGVPELFDKPPPGRDALTVQTAGQWTMASNRGPNAVKTQESLHTKTRKAVPSSTSVVDELVITSNGATYSRSSSLNSRSSGTSEGLSSRRELSPRIDDSSPARRSPQSKPLPRTHAYYEEAVKGLLKPGQRALFFGKGTMGVVLKPTYLASWRGKDGGGVISPALTSKRGGVYIDSFIPGGHAERSGVVFVGDHVIKIGAVNVENMTLEEVVTVIAESKRPNIMVLTSEHFVQVVDKPEEESRSSVAAAGGDDSEEDSGTTKRNKRCFVSPLDMAFGFVNNLVAEGILDVERQVTVNYDLKHTMSGTSLLDNAEDEDSVNNDDDDDANSEEEVSFKSPAKEKASASSESIAVLGASDVNVISSDENGDGSYFVDLASRPATDDGIKPIVDQEIIHAHIDPADIDNLSEYAAHRTNIHDPYDTECQHQRASLLKRVALFNPDIRCILRLSLLECVSDPRRYSFLEHYFRNYRSMKELDGIANNYGQNVTSDDHDDVTSSSNQIRLLDLYLELNKFHEAFMLCECSLLDREKLLNYARSIAARFLSDHVSADDKAKVNCLSDYVGYIALGGMEQVQAVRFSLRDEDEFFDGDDSSDGFDAIRLSLESFLSTQESFISFLLSDDCTRMRAYLRGSSSFLRIEPRKLLSTDARGADSVSHHNFLLCAILHLVCMKSERSKSTSDNFIKNDALLLSAGKRNLGAVSLLSCAFFIMCKLRSKVEAVVEGLIEDGMTGTRNNLPLYTVYIKDVQFLWEVYVAPAGGALSLLRLSPDSQEALDGARRALLSSIDDGDTIKEDMDDAVLTIKVAKSLSSVHVSSSIYSLAEALFREYTLEIYPNFQRHIFYEWACKESKIAFSYARDADTGFEHLVSSKYAGLSKGWLNRFIRQSELPEGISLHRRSGSAILPQNGNDTTTTDAANRHCGDVALVFGSEYYDEAAIRRFCCVPLHSDCPQNNVLLPEDVPPIFESYAEVPVFHDRPFQGTLKDRISIDGWEVSLTNFVIPSQANKGPSNEKWIYCVSLVLRKSTKNGRPQMSEGDIDKECVRELRHDESFNSEAGPDCFQSPLFAADSSEDGAVHRVMKVNQELSEFNNKIKSQKWSHHVGKGATIGLTLMSSSNVMHGMRETLSLLYDDFCTIKSDTNRKHLCQPLVDILGVLTYCPSGGLCSSPARSKRVETTSLRCLLQPYCMYTKSKWVHRPLSIQSEIFLESAGLVLLQALPPVPLALAFIALLLEQKVRVML